MKKSELGTNKCGYCNRILPENPTRMLDVELGFCDSLCLRLWYNKKPTRDRVDFVRNTMKYHAKCLRHANPETYVYGVLVKDRYVHVSYSKHPERVAKLGLLASDIVILEESTPKQVRSAVIKWKGRLLK